MADENQMVLFDPFDEENRQMAVRNPNAIDPYIRRARQAYKAYKAITQAWDATREQRKEAWDEMRRIKRRVRNYFARRKPFQKKISQSMVKKRTRNGKKTYRKRRKTSRYSKKTQNKIRKTLIKRYVNKLVRRSNYTDSSPPMNECVSDGHHLTSALHRVGYRAGWMNYRSSIVDLLTNHVYKYNDSGVATQIDFSAKPNCRVKVWKTVRRYIVKNNTTVDAKVHVWVYQPRRPIVDAADDAHAALTQGLRDNHNDTTPPAIEHSELPFYWPKDSRLLSHRFKELDHKYFSLAPGEEFRYTVVIPTFTFNPDETTNTAAIQRYSRCILFRTQGSVMHDEAATPNVGLNESAIDIYYTQRRKFSFFSTDTARKDVRTPYEFTLTGPAAEANDDGEIKQFDL
jgi:hypothetical protein